jgi:2-hydroxy-6-oxonona-2,4-dienedioate hydrolase
MRRLLKAPRLRLGLGVLALLLVLAAEVLLVLPLRGLSLSQYFATLDPLAASLYYAMLVLFSVLPAVVPPTTGRALVSAVLVLTFGASTAAVYVNYRHDVEAQRARVASGSQLAQTACGPIEYAVTGEGPAVLLVHGAGGGFDQGLGIARELAGFRVITMSRFGYLRTPLPRDASPAAQADAHACLLDALRIERAAIAGVSAGGPSTLQFALRHPARTRAMVLLVPLAYVPGDAAPAAPPRIARFMYERGVRSDFLYWMVLKGAPRVVIGTILATPPELVAQAQSSEQARVREMMERILPVRERRDGLLNDAAVAASLARYDLERVSVPSLLVSAKDDRYGTYASAAYTANAIPGARFIGYERGGHVWVGRHDEVMAQIRAFLR